MVTMVGITLTVNIIGWLGTWNNAAVTLNDGRNTSYGPYSIL